VRAVLAGTCGDQRREASEAGSDPGVSLIHEEVEQLQWRLGDSIEGPAVMLLPQVPGSKEDRGVEGPPKLTGQPYPCQLPPVAEHGPTAFRQQKAQGSVGRAVNLSHYLLRFSETYCFCLYRSVSTGNILVEM